MFAWQFMKALGIQRANGWDLLRVDAEPSKSSLPGGGTRDAPALSLGRHEIAKLPSHAMALSHARSCVSTFSAPAPISRISCQIRFLLISSGSFQRAMGIRGKPIAPASPWQNGFVERLIGSIRRECVDHIIVLGQAHLRRFLKSYARCYNETRTHLALDKDAPVSRPVERTGVVRSLATPGGLHHHVLRI
jgi:hypothetical protein